MRDALTSVARGAQAESVNGLKSPAINVARVIQFHSNRRRVDQSFVAIALVPAGPRSREPEGFRLAL